MSFEANLNKLKNDRSERDSVFCRIESDVSLKNDLLGKGNPKLILGYINLPAHDRQLIVAEAENKGDWMAMVSLLDTVNRLDKVVELLRAMKHVGQSSLANRLFKGPNQTIAE